MPPTTARCSCSCTFEDGGHQTETVVEPGVSAASTASVGGGRILSRRCRARRDGKATPSTRGHAGPRLFYAPHDALQRSARHVTLRRDPIDMTISHTNGKRTAAAAKLLHQLPMMSTEQHEVWATSSAGFSPVGSEKHPPQNEEHASSRSASHARAFGRRGVKERFSDSLLLMRGGYGGLRRGTRAQSFRPHTPHGQRLLGS